MTDIKCKLSTIQLLSQKQKKEKQEECQHKVTNCIQDNKFTEISNNSTKHYQQKKHKTITETIS
jgi:hypothetical protein